MIWKFTRYSLLITFFSVSAVNAQNVGIGESAPGSKGAIKGNLSVGNSYSTIAAPANGAIIEGNVGIGTTSVSAKLHVSGNGGVFRMEGTDHAYIEFYPDGPTTRKAWIGFGGGTDDNLSIVNQISNANIYLSTTGTGKVVIPSLSTGYVKSNASGVLTHSATVPWSEVSGAPAFITSYTETDPQVGTISTSYIPRWNGIALVTGTVQDNGTNVGIGVSPSEKLHVSTNVRADGVVYWGNGLVRTETRNDAGLQGDAGARSGFFETSAPAPAANWPAGASSWWHMLDVRHSNNTNNYAMQIAGSFYDQNLWFRKTNGSASTGWSRVISTNDVSGTTNYISKFTGGNSIGNSQIFDNGSSIGIGTTSPGSKFHINGGNIKLADTPGQTPFEILSYANANSLWLVSPTSGSRMVLGTALDWDRGVEFSYTPGTIGGASGDLYIGQVAKNNANFTHGSTRFFTNGAERLRINSAGNIGVGTTIPQAKMHITNSDPALTGVAAAGLLMIGGKNDVFNNQFINFRNPSVTDGSIAGMSWWSADVIFGRDRNKAMWGYKETHGSPLGNSTKDVIYFDLVDNSGYQYVNQLVLTTENTTTAGQVGIGVTTPTYKVQLPNNSSVSIGSTIAYDYWYYSDERLKSNFAPLTYGLAAVMQLNPVSYIHHNSIKDEKGNVIVDRESGAETFGLKAQDVYKIIPELVSKPVDESTENWAVSYGKFTPVLIKAIQEQQQEIEVLKKQNERISKLEEELIKLKQQIENK